MSLDKQVEEYRDDALKILNRRYKMYIGFSIFLLLFVVGGPIFIIVDNLRRDISNWSDLAFFLLPSPYIILVVYQFTKIIKVRRQVRESTNVFTIHAEFRTPQAGLKRFFIFNRSSFGYVATLANPSRWYSPKVLPEYDCVIFADSSFTSFDSPIPNWESMPLYIPENRLIYRLSNKTKDFKDES